MVGFYALNTILRLEEASTQRITLAMILLLVTSTFDLFTQHKGFPKLIMEHFYVKFDDRFLR